MDALTSSDVFLFDRFRLHRRGGRLLRQGASGDWQPVAIGSRAIDALGVLLEQHGDLVSKDEIIRAVWSGAAVEESNLTVQISALRRALDQGRTGESCIQTVTGKGYRFVLLP
jgi:DNA-binding winged helix-turn-helix (wHTH) protein